jgi:enoyl-[acyl-carrier protein] reductase III
LTDAGFELRGQRVLVTGGTRGIGRAISLQFARNGAAVIANYARNDAAAQALAEEAASDGLSLEVLRADLTSAKGLATIDERLSTGGEGKTLSLVHCAATGVHRKIDEFTLKHWDWTHALNVRAFFELVRSVLPRLTAGSTIVVVSSAGARRAVPAYAAVGSSKAALESLARHLAVELAPRGIRVNVLQPGSVETEAWDSFPDKTQRIAEASQRTPSGHLVQAAEVARAAQFLCSAAASGIIGHTLVIDGGRSIVE